MKLNDLQKNFYIFFSVIISILIATLLWEKITLPLNNTIGTKESIESKGYDNFNDTIRYIFFISFPLIVFLFVSHKLKKNTIEIRKLLFEEDGKVKNYHPALIILLFIFIIFIFLEFFSVNFSTTYRIDQSHHGNFLTPAQNYISTNNLWTSTYLVHGISDILYPVLMWKIFGVSSIGAASTLNLFLILFIKLLCVLLSYQLTKISNLNKETKILFFTIFTSILISMSKYAFLGENYYFKYSDIYIILFLILFIELFIYSKFRLLSLFLICIIATFSILAHVDTGSYINFILASYFLYLLITKKYKDAILIFFSLVICWAVTINLIGLDEFKAYLYNTKTLILSMDSIHGIKYPEPFFSITESSVGTRATRGLLLQLTAGLFVLNSLISNKNKIFSSKKILFVFLFLLSFIMYKNALGRSDAPHIRGSNDLPILINVFFILNYLLIFFEKIFLSYKRTLSYKTFFSLSIFFLLFYYIYNNNNYRINNIKHYKKNFLTHINVGDKIYLDQKTAKLIEYYKQITEKENCVEIITYDDALPYLLKKPSCTKYFVSWLASSAALQKDYIFQLKKIQPKYILYFSVDQKFDGVGVFERINLVHSYIMSNYQKYDEFDDYVVLEKK